MPQHLLDRAEVGSTLQEVGREGVAEEMGVHASGLEARSIGELAENEEDAGTRQRAAARVEEQLGPIPAIEVWPAERQVPPHRLGGRPSERNEPLLVSLSEHADDPLVEGDAALLEPDCLGDAQTSSVEELDERAIAERSRARACRGVDEALGLGRRERPRQRARTSR